MREGKIVCLLLCLVAFFCGCSRGSATDGKTVAQTQNDDFSHIKKHVVWYHDEMVTSGVDANIFAKLNKLLLERGYDFVVDLVTEPSMESYQCQEYQSKLRSYQEDGVQVDLIFSGWGMVEGMTTYDDAVQDGLLLPLNDFFADAEEGKRLWEAFPENVWNMLERDGQVYGVCNTGWYGEYYSATLNRELLETYQVQPPEEFSFSAYLETIKKVKEKANAEGKEVFPLYLTADAVYSYLGYYKVGEFWLKKAEDGRVAYVNPYADEAAREVFEVLAKYHEAFGGYGTIETYWTSLRADNQVASFVGTLPNFSCENRNIYYPAYTYEPDRTYYAMPIQNIIHGISSWATYPEEAKTLLTLISTDEEVANLLYYGMEGVNYQLEDGRAVPSKERGRIAPGFEVCVNDAIVYPKEAESSHKTELLKKQKEQVIFLPLELYKQQEEPLSVEEETLAELFRRAEGLWLGTYENAEEVAEQICLELENANADAVLKARTERLYRGENVK